MADYAPEVLSPEECKELGVVFPSVRMQNGEYRFRCFDENDGYGYALTKMPASVGGWQNSHYHKSVVETYIVQNGWIGFACLDSDILQLALYRAGEVVTTEINQSHNIFMPTGAVIHTVKHGDCSTPNDWFASPDLDAKTKHLTEEAILSLVAVS